MSYSNRNFHETTKTKTPVANNNHNDPGISLISTAATCTTSLILNRRKTRFENIYYLRRLKIHASRSRKKSMALFAICFIFLVILKLLLFICIFYTKQPVEVDLTGILSTTTTNTTTTTTRIPPNTSQHLVKLPSVEMQIMEKSINQSIDPCHDFYRYVCEGVMEAKVKTRFERAATTVASLVRDIYWKGQVGKALKYFQQQYSSCTTQECLDQTVEHFKMPLALAIMDDLNLWPLSKSIVDQTRKAFIQSIEQSRWMETDSKAIAIRQLEMTDVHLGLPIDFASWDVLNQIYDYGLSQGVDFDIDSWYVKIFQKPPNRFVHS